jgi:tetraacyldisaccharide 4'-kinase
MLPRGILREPVANLSRGTFIFVTKCDGPVPPELEAEIRRHNSTAEIVACAHRPREFVEVDGPGRYPLDYLKGKRVMAFSGIATPERFEATLRDVGVNLVANRRFLDHHAFAEEDLDEILERALRAKADYIVTTEKDAVRLQTEFHPSIPLLYIRLDVDILGGNEGFNSAIERICLGSGR